MQRTVKAFHLKTTKHIKKKLLYWSDNYDVALWLDSNNYQQHYSSFDAILALEECTAIETDYINAFEKLSIIFRRRV